MLHRHRNYAAEGLPAVEMRAAAAVPEARNGGCDAAVSQLGLPDHPDQDREGKVSRVSSDWLPDDHQHRHIVALPGMLYGRHARLTVNRLPTGTDRLRRASMH